MVGVGVGITAVSLLRKVIGGISSSIAGLTENPSVGTTAQLGTTLTAVVSNAPQGATITYAWKEGTTTRGTGSTFVVTGVADLSNLTLVATVNGTEYPAGPYPVTQVPPTTTGTLSDLTATQGSGTQTVNVASVFSGSSLTYSVASNTIGVTINSTTGVASIPFATVYAATTVTYTATNSGGSATRTQVITSTESVAQNITVAISGLTNNATYGQTAQYGTTLTATVTGLVGGETVVYEWREGTVPRATGSTLALTAGGDFGDNQSLTLAVIVNGTEYTDGPYTIRRAPPTGLSSLADVTASEGDAAETVNVAATVSGTGLSYSVAANSIGVTIDAATGVASIPFNAPFSATTITYTATNSGGSISRAHSVTANAVTISPLLHSMEQIVSGATDSAYAVSGTLSTVAGATGTMIYIVSRVEDTFVVTVNGVQAEQIGRHASYRASGTSFRTCAALFYAPQGNGAWTITRATGTAVIGYNAQAYRLTGATLRSFKCPPDQVKTITPATGANEVANFTMPVTWRNGDMLISSIINDVAHAPTPGTWTVDASLSERSNSIQAYVTSQKQTSDGGETLAFNSVNPKDACSWMVVIASQYPAVIAKPADPPVSNFTYPLNAARTQTTVAVAGTHSGPAGDIYERVVLDNGTEVVPWTLVAAGATGTSYSGSLTIPASGLNALYREAKKGITGNVKRQTANFQVGLLYLGSGQSNYNQWAESKQSTPAKHVRAAGYNADTGVYITGSNIGNGMCVFLNQRIADTGLPCCMVYASKGGSSIQVMAPGFNTGDGTLNIYQKMSAYLATLPGKIHGMVWIHGENEANAVTQKTAEQYSAILVDQIQAGYAGVMGQTVNDFPVLMTSLATFGGGEGASANYSYRWGYWQGVQNALPGIAPSLHMAAYAHDMVRDSSYHYEPQSCERLGLRLADYARKLEVGGAQNPWRITSAVRVDARTIDVTMPHSMGTDFNVVTLPHETNVGSTSPGSTIQGFAVRQSVGSTIIPCTAVKTGANKVRLTMASDDSSANKLLYAWGLQGQSGQTPPDITDGLIVDNSPLANPLAFAVDFPVT